ncbi:hypothetical protein LOTGIDRAFT_232871 [Lottia gigantea]|uniref:IRS-type PTB domain-containing protein n=1 Tax=Lottia gigantea TaxID=225164 RepID=V3ZMW9_LOTGI|nr:hypothetical protein LOTGIDRAFT_232871 [Lottia gigantea]ESO92723.1 hypothetical protein LOTGIDRAFT_232871 [Lottia gigantea]
MEGREEVIFEDFFYQYNIRRTKLFLGKKGKWKLKYLILRIQGEKPIIEIYSKKPKNNSINPKGEFVLWPTFRVEKSINAKNRQFSFEISTPDQQLCLSSDSKKTADIFVFLLQIQTKLKSQVQDDIFNVDADDSDASKDIGAVDSPCILHLSPCGITLALKESRSVLAQWPLKSIRCFESSGFGQLTLEAGRVAPMGEGVYNFQCLTGDDNEIYDILDQYIVNTLDKAKPHKKGTAEEIAEYLEEFDKLHGLTTVSVQSKNNSDIISILKTNFNYDVNSDSHDENDETDGVVRRTKLKVHSRSQTASIGYRKSQFDPRSVNPVRPPPPPLRKTHGSNDHDATLVTSRPPPPPPRPGSGNRIPNCTRPHRSRQRRSSSISSANSGGSINYIQGDNSHHSSMEFPPPPPEALLNVHSSYYEGTQTTGRMKSSREKKHRTENLKDSQKATSCEDLSSHMKTVLYRDNSVDSLDDLVHQTDENMYTSKLPVPFPKLQEFRASDDFDKHERDRSQSVDYYNSRRDSSVTKSPGPSARHLRRILSKQKHHETLRKSNSNPNFLNVGSKQNLYAQSNGVKSPSHGSPTLSHKTKQASRSLSSIFPGNLRRALSRERVKTDKDSRSNTPSHSRSNSIDRSSIRRRRSNSIRGPSIKDINFTERTRSFRKVKTTDQKDNISQNANNNNNNFKRAINGPITQCNDINDNIRASARRKENPGYNRIEKIIRLPSREREETRC